MNNKSVQTFALPIRLLHWAMAIAIVAMIFIGIYMANSAEGEYLSLVSWHKTVGISVLFFAFIRLAIRLLTASPALPEDMDKMQKVAAKGSHVVLYILMIVLPLIGWGMLSAGDYPVTLLNHIVLPSIYEPDIGVWSWLRGAHKWFGYLFFAIILLHLSAALFHGLIRKDGVLSTMLFRRK